MLSITLKNSDIIKKFQENFPNTISESLDETASFGKSRIMEVTARGATGLAQASWVVKNLDKFSRAIINTKFYAKFLETGTGLYGPLKKRITSKSGGPLRWISFQKSGPSGTQYRSRMGSKKGGFSEKGVFAMSTKGMKAQPMVAPNIDIIKADLVKRMELKIKALWGRIS